MGLGGIAHLKVLGQSLIILNSHKTAMEVLDKRGAIHSGRPRFPLAEMYEHPFDISDGLITLPVISLGFVQALVFLEYGEDFRLHRRMMSKYFVKDKILEHHPIQVREARILVRNLVSNPDKRSDHLVR